MSEQPANSIERAHRRLDELETDVRYLRDGQDKLSATQNEMSRNMAAGHAELRELLRNRTSLSLRGVALVMSIIVMGGTIIASVVGGIVYISGNANERRIATMENKIGHIVDVLSWRVELKRGPNGGAPK